MVHQLVDQNNGKWNEQLVNFFFLLKKNEKFFMTDVEKILRIPLLDVSIRNQIIWHFGKHGNYTVKSAYRVCMERLFNRDELKVPGDWSLIWSLRAPPMVVMMRWKKTGICSGSACAVLISGRIWESKSDSTQLRPVQLVLHRCSSKSVSGWIMEIWPHSAWYYGALGIEDTTNYETLCKKKPFGYWLEHLRCYRLGVMLGLLIEATRSSSRCITDGILLLMAL